MLSGITAHMKTSMPRSQFRTIHLFPCGSPPSPSSLLDTATGPRSGRGALGAWGLLWISGNGAGHPRVQAHAPAEAISRRGYYLLCGLGGSLRIRGCGEICYDTEIMHDKNYGPSFSSPPPLGRLDIVQITKRNFPFYNNLLGRPSSSPANISYQVGAGGGWVALIACFILPIFWSLPLGREAVNPSTRSDQKLHEHYKNTKLSTKY